MDSSTQRSQRTLFLASATLGIIWVYHGLVPKILFPDTGEMELLKGLGLFQGYETTVLILMGLAEVLFGLTIFFVRRKLVHILNLLALLSLAGGVIVSKPLAYAYPFNPFSLTIAMMALSIICITSLPSTSRD